MMKRILVLVALVALGVVAVAGIAYAFTFTGTPGNDVFVETNDPDTGQCTNDEAFGGVVETNCFLILRMRPTALQAMWTLATGRKATGTWWT